MAGVRSSPAGTFADASGNDEVALVDEMAPSLMTTGPSLRAIGM